VTTPFLIGVAGPSGSGKSTLVRAIEERYPSIARVRFDNYFKEPEECPQVNGETFWDTPESLYLDTLHTNLLDLHNGKSTHAPLDYDRIALTRSWGMIEPAPVMITEGFLLFTDERIRDLFDVRIYMDLPEELQLVRRMERTPREDYVRDIVIANYRPHGIVARQYAHHIVDAARPQEVIQDEIAELLREAAPFLL
jgi:uridine kinase